MNKKNKTLKATFVVALENYKKKDYKNAEICCYKILSIDPNHFDSISMLATLAAINGNFDKAVELLSKAIEIEPKNTVIINNLGTAYQKLGQLKEAVICQQTKDKKSQKWQPIDGSNLTPCIKGSIKIQLYI